MEVLNKEIDINNFFRYVKDARDRILLLDYDGTLAPFKIKRDEAVPYEGVEDILDEIMESGTTRVVLISGRCAKDLLKLLKLKNRPEIWGSHGWERMLPDNTYYIEKTSKNSLKALKYAEDWLREEGLYRLCEPKPVCIALHWRGLEQSEIEGINKKVREKWPLVPHNDELLLTGFDGGIEIRVPGKDKGDAVKRILSESESDPAVAYLGDDKSDECAFRALGNNGLSVLVRKELRPTCADTWIRPPEEMLSFLNDWMTACSSGSKK